MGSCLNCHNILPRTVDRCPVCGVAVPVASTDADEPVFVEPAWKSTQAEPRPEPSTLSPDEFLREFEQISDPAPVPEQLDTAPPVLSPPSLPPPSLRGPSQPAPRPPDPVPQHPTPSQSAPPQPAPPQSTPSQPAPPHLAPPQPAPAQTSRPPRRTQPSPPPLAAPRPDPIPVTAEARSVVAQSSRIEGDIKLGPSERHSVIVLAVTAMGVGALALGMLAGFGIGDSAATLAYADDTTTPSATVVEEITSASTDDQFESFIADRADGFVTLERNDCGLEGRAVGIVTDDLTVITTADALTLDSTPVVIGTDGTRVNGTVLGVSRENDLAVVRIDAPVGTPLVLGTAGPIRSGAPLIGISSGPDGVAGAEVEVAEIRRPLGFVESLTFVEGDELAHGSVVTTLEGALVAIANRAGTGARTIDQIRPVISEIITTPDMPASQCPPPPEPEDGTADGTAEGVDATTETGADATERTPD